MNVHVHVFSLDIMSLFSLHRRMQYADAIVYLKENNITKDDGTFYEFGEVGGIFVSMILMYAALIFTGYTRSAGKKNDRQNQ